MAGRALIAVLVMVLAAPPLAMAQSSVSLPIARGLWTSDRKVCSAIRHAYIFDGARWGALYFYGPDGSLGPVAELRPITATRSVGGGFTQMQFGGFDGASFFRVKAVGPDKALYRVGAPHRETIQVMDEALIRCSFQSLSPRMKAAISRFAPALAKLR